MMPHKRKLRSGKQFKLGHVSLLRSRNGPAASVSTKGRRSHLLRCRGGRTIQGASVSFFCFFFVYLKDKSYFYLFCNYSARTVFYSAIVRILDAANVVGQQKCSRSADVKNVVGQMCGAPARSAQVAPLRAVTASLDGLAVARADHAHTIAWYSSFFR